MLLIWHITLSRVQLFATPRIVAHQASLSMGFSQHEHWSGLPFSSPRDLPDPGIEPGSPALQADSLSFELQGSLADLDHAGNTTGLDRLLVA